VFLKYGFMDQPDIPLALSEVRQPGLELPPDVSYFLGRETVLATEKPGMAVWRERLFVWMSRNAQSATHFFRLPPEQVIEVGVQVEL
jgi:KUP system potassium uptake protein